MKEVEEINDVKEIMGPEVQKRFDKYTYSPTHNNCFYGTKHNHVELMQNSGSITVDREGGITLAILSMLNEEVDGKPKYTIDQLLDPNQFQKEKQERFDEIVQKSRNTAKDKDKSLAESADGKWIVENLYKGMKRLKDMIDEAAEKIDMTKDNFMYSEEFARVAGLSGIAFDAWQEINRFEKMMNEVVLADRPELNTEEARRNHIDNLVPPVSKTFQTINKAFDCHNRAGIDDVKPLSYIPYAIHIKYAEKVMRDWKKSGKKLSQYMAENKIARKFDNNQLTATFLMGDMAGDFITNVRIGDVVDRRIQDGSLLKNVEYDDVNDKIINFPKMKDDGSDFIIEELAAEKKAAPKKDTKTVDEIAFSKIKWEPIADKINQAFVNVHKKINMMDPRLKNATDIVMGFIEMKSDASKCVPTLKNLAELLQQKHVEDKTFYEEVSEGMKPGEFYGLLSELNEEFGNVIDMEAIGKIKPMDKAAYDAVKKEEAEAFKPGDDYSKKVEKYSFSLNRELRQSFLGDKYTAEQIRTDPKYSTLPISFDRTGGYSIAALHLLSMKKNGKRVYSVEDVFNPNKFRKEKLEEFDEILDHTIKTDGARKSVDKNNEHAKWLVDTMYTSIKETVNLIDELAEKIDFNDENFDKSEEYFQINLLGNIIHDAWQEICTFPDLMDEKLKKDYPNLRNKKQRYDAFQDIVGPISDIGAEMIVLNTEHNALVNKYEDPDMHLSRFVNAAIKQGPARDMFKEWHEKGNGKSLTQYFRDNQFGARYYVMNDAADKANGSIIESCSGTYEREKKIDSLYMNGTLYKNVTYTPGKKGKAGVFNNVPTYDREKDQVVFPKVKLDKMAGKKTEKKTEAKPEKKTVKNSSKKSSKKEEPTIRTNYGEDIPVNEVIDYLQALKQTAGEARGFFNDSEQFMDFYMAIDDVMEAARDLKKNQNVNILNEDNDKLKDYKEAVNRLKDCAEAYEVYKMSDHTKDTTKEPDKKALNGDDKRKLKIMNGVLRNNRYFDVAPPKITNEEFLAKADRALFRLQQGDYKYKQNYIEDSAYAMYGQMYRVGGNKDKTINLQEIVQEKLASGEFEKTLISKKNPKKYISPEEVAKKAQNVDKMKELADTVKREIAENKDNVIREAPKKGPAHKNGNDIGKEKGKGRGPV
ncbi:hypothetical protein SAMN02910369_00690 [Lachnospiraceae bacterium NE2001]|nr:hypothetical protein SAMN02910369_00690 [Lachnospiraceae bacterium NE2001]